MDVKILKVDRDWLPGIWRQAEPFLKRSFEAGEYEMPHDLFEQILNGDRQLWVLIHPRNELIGAGITAIYTMVYGKMLKIEHLGGDHLQSWIDRRSIIEAYAKDQGCGRVMFEGRLGWIRLLSDYDPVAVTLEKRL